MVSEGGHPDHGGRGRSEFAGLFGWGGSDLRVLLQSA